MKEIIRRQDEKLFASLSQEQVKELTFYYKPFMKT